jgi:CheY-like chemotaxis protein
MKKRILVVDDEAAITRLVRLNLERTGRYEVREENDAARALTAAQEYQPDLILLDVIMPELDGSDVVARLKTDARLKNVPIVFLTATVRKTEVVAHGGIIGGFSFLGKPASAAEIIECVEKNLSAT